LQPKSDQTPNIHVFYTPNTCSTNSLGYHVPSNDEADRRAGSSGGDRDLLLRGTVVARCADLSEDEGKDAFSFCLAVFSFLLSRPAFFSALSFFCSSFFLFCSAFCAMRL
jgi:hypothetical protein